MDFSDIFDLFSFFGNKFRYYASLLLVVISLLFTASVWSTPPSLAYMAIPLGAGFSLILTALWAVDFIKTNYGKFLLIINLIVCSYSIIIIVSTQSSFPSALIWIGCYSNILAAVTTMILGVLHHLNQVKILKKNIDDELLDSEL